MRRKLLIGALVGLVALGQMTVESAAQGVENLNAIIQSLTPAPETQRETPKYRANVRRVQIPYRAPGAPRSAPLQNRYIMLDYNRSIDLEIFFKFDSDAITPAAAEQLDLLGQALVSPGLDHAVYLLAGHTDAKGSDDYNQWLSERRALSAKAYLVENFSIAPERLIAVGFGETQLRDPDHPRAAINRRVEVTLVDSGEMPAVSDVVPAPGTGNVVCDTTTTVREDERPANNGLDDFGGRRTNVDCADMHDQAEPDETVGAVPDAAGGTPPADDGSIDHMIVK